MQIRLKNTSNDFGNNALAFLPPVAEGLQYWNVFGPTAEHARRNLAPGKNPSALVGEQFAYGANYVETNGGSYIQLDATESENLTWFVVHSITESRAMPMGTFGGDSANDAARSTFGTAFMTDGSAGSGGYANDLVNMLAIFCGRDPSTGALNQNYSRHYNLPVADGQLARVLRVQEPAGVMTHTLLKSGATEVITRPSPNIRDRAIDRIAIGSSIKGQVGTYSGLLRTYAAIAYSRYLNDTEVQTIYTWLKNYFAKRNIAI